MPTSAAPRRTPAKGGNSGSGMASGDTGVDMVSFPVRPMSYCNPLFGGRWLGIVGRTHRRAVEIEFFHLHLRASMRHGLLHGLLDHLLPQLLAGLLEARRRIGALLQHLDHVPAELRVDRCWIDLPRLQGEGG